MPTKRQAASLILTCEHASNAVPRYLEVRFQNRRSILSTHRAWDEGAVEIARALHRKLDAPLVEGRFTRLVVDLNRSRNHRKVFSEFTKPLSDDLKGRILSEIYEPFRNDCHARISKMFAKSPSRPVLHFSVHSFVPILNGERRNCDIGLLYDPSLERESYFAHSLRRNLERHLQPEVRIRMNYPYRGTSDGHPTALRKSFSEKYVGFEIEFNQAWLRKLNRQGTHERVCKAFSIALKKSLDV